MKIKEMFLTLIIVPIGLLLMIGVKCFCFYKLGMDESVDYWINIMATLLAGSFTLLGVVLTLWYQKRNDQEIRRLENMPIFNFTSRISTLGDFKGEEILTIFQKELCSSAFPRNEKIFYPILIIENVSGHTAFNVKLEECYLCDGFNKRENKDYQSVGCRLLPGKSKEIFLHYESYKKAVKMNNLECNIFCLFRFSYLDIFGNKYYQDVPFIFDEDYEDQPLIEFRNIHSPIYLGENENKHSIDAEIRLYEDFIDNSL